MDPNAATTSSFRSHSGPLRKAAATSSFSGPLFQHRPLILQPAAAGSRTLMDLRRRLDLARSSLRTRDLGPLRPHRRLPAVDAATHALSTEAEAFFAVSAVVTVREKLEGFCEVSYENQASAPAAPPPPPPPPVGYWESQVWKPPAVATPKSITLKKPVSREERDDAATEAEAVRASSDRVMVWDQLKSSSFQVNEEMIETLFGCNAANAAASNAPIAQNGEQSA